MSQRVLITCVSDLSDGEVGESGQDVRFTYRSREYTIDLTDEELAEFDKVMDKYVRAASKVTGRRRRRTVPSTAPDPQAVRAWARSKGIKVSPYGKPPRDVVDRFLAAGN